MQYVHDTEFYIINSECRSNKDKRAFRNQAKNELCWSRLTTCYYTLVGFFGESSTSKAQLFIYLHHTLSPLAPLWQWLLILWVPN